MKLKRVDFRGNMPSPRAVAVPVPFLQVGKEQNGVGHPERYVDELEDRDGYIWTGDVGYPRECIARVVRLVDEDRGVALVDAPLVHPCPTCGIMTPSIKQYCSRACYFARNKEAPPP